MSIDHEAFNASIVAGDNTFPLDSINNLGDGAPQPGCPKDFVAAPTAGAGITMLTSDFGEATLQDIPSTDAKSHYTISGGVAKLIDAGAPVGSPQGYLPSGENAETVLGLSADGRHATITVFDQNADSAGVNWQDAQLALKNQGADSGILFDGGGSSTLVAQLTAPTAGDVTVLDDQTGDNNYPNGPSNQRYVGDGLFFAGTALAPQPTSTPAAGSEPALADSGSDLPFGVAMAGILLALGAALSAVSLTLEFVWRSRRTA